MDLELFFYLIICSFLVIFSIKGRILTFHRAEIEVFLF